MSRISRLQRVAFFIAVVAVPAISARAQSLIVANGTVLAANGDQAPGQPAGCLLDGAGTFDVGVMDDVGNVFFRSRLTGTGVTTTNERAYFVGTNRANLAVVIRAADPVPSLGGGSTLNTAGGTGIGATVRISSAGQMFWISSFSGGSATTANDTAIFTGTTGNFVIAAREGSAQPGTVGATFPNLSALTQEATQINPSGRIAFTCSTVGGDTTAGNNAAWFGGLPGALEMIMRKGSAIPTGETVGTVAPLLIYNASGEALHEVTLTLSGSTTTLNDKVLLVYTPGITPGTGTNAVLLREGALATGTLGATYGLVNINTSPFSYGASPWNNNGKLLVACALAAGSGDTVVGINDSILYLAQTSSSPTVVLRKGDVVPGAVAGETFGVINAQGSALNNADHVAFRAQLVGGVATSTSDSAIWWGPVGGLELVVREGDLAPGTLGAVFGDLLGLANFGLNDADQLTFNATLIGGDVTGPANNSILYSWEPDNGLAVVIRAGDVIEVSTGVFKTVSSWAGLQFANGDARGLTFNHAGKMTLRVNFTDGSAAIMTVYAPRDLGTPFCSGDGTGAACPCGNSGSANHGCANSGFATGAHISAAGVASVTPEDDSMVLEASNVTGPGLFFQGSGQFAGGLGLAFGDGLLCAGGAILRLGVVFPTSGMATYPGGLTPNPIHIGGATSAGDVRHYQCWYRDAISFCSSSTYNLTQGTTVTWGL